MKKFNSVYSISLMMLLFVFASCKTQQKTAQQISKSKESITLRCEMESCTGPLYLFDFDGYTFVLNQTAQPDSNNQYTFTVPVSDHTFYFVGTNKKQTKPIILGTEKNLKLKGNCGKMRQSKFENSPINTEYERAIGQVRGYQGTANFLNQQYAKAPLGSEKKAEFLKKLEENDRQQMALLSDMRVKYPFVGKIIATKTFLSFPNNKGGYDTEVQYFVNEYFSNVDLSDPALDRMPAIFETFRDYTTTLAAIRFDQPKMKTTLDNVLNKMNAESKAYRFALGAIVQTLNGKNHPAFADYANLFVEKYGHENASYMSELRTSVSSAKNFIIGAVAPDFEQKTPEGESMKLSDLRGKVVLVDFWASWCGPCRRENPNVVNLYNKYKADGFDVLGVSLDRTKNKWTGAIEKDKLEWHHVSDLKGWKNAVAKQYSVRSIPHTILLDRDGKIIARNIRSHELAGKLKEIFNK